MSESPLDDVGGLVTLIDDCLLHLFRFISLADLGSVKDTCKRLCQVADQSFKLYGDKTLTISRSSMVADIWNLKHFGKFIKSLTLTDCYKQYCSNQDIFEVISQFSTEELESISLCVNYDESITDDSLKCLQKVLKNVTIITFRDFHERNIELLLSYCENLMEIDINGEEVDLKTLWCSKNLNIERITLTILHKDDILEEICEKLVGLKSLSLDCNPEKTIRHLSRLNHLKQLKIGSFCSNIGSLLQDLIKNDVLEYLSLSFLIMDEIIAHALVEMSNLKELVLMHSTQFEENTLDILSKKLNNIEKLSFIGCEEITFGEITKIIQNLLNLKELSVIECERIDFIDRVNYLRLRKQRNLQIFLDNDEYERTLKLISNDLSDYVRVEKLAHL